MENATLIAASRAVALERQMSVIANNVANMDTNGFKSGKPLFIEQLNKMSDTEKYSMVENRGILRDLSSGPVSQTGNPLDLALEGDGYFTVDTLNGPRYTRAGNFSLNDQRELTNANGLPVLDENGSRLSIPANARDINISDDGMVTTELGQVGRIGVVRFEREQFMTELGNSLYSTDENPIAEPATKIRQGFLEGSNVQAVREMTDMIEVNRQYQNIQKILSNEHDRLRNAYSKLSKLS